MPSAQISRVPGNCGLLALLNHEAPENLGWPPVLSLNSIKRLPSTGFGVTGFVNAPRCKAVYEWLKENTTIVYQSPVRTNRNTRHPFFFVVFDSTPTAKEIKYGNA